VWKRANFQKDSEIVFKSAVTAVAVIEYPENSQRFLLAVGFESYAYLDEACM
jgi:hypothetical protein